MISEQQFKYIQKIKKYEVCTAPRATGKTFRSLLQAAHTASVGDNVLMWCYNDRIAVDMPAVTLRMFESWGFHQPYRRVIEQRNSGGVIVFHGLPHKYSEYTRLIRGVNTMEIFDI